MEPWRVYEILVGARAPPITTDQTFQKGTRVLPVTTDEKEKEKAIFYKSMCIFSYAQKSRFRSNKGNFIQGGATYNPLSFKRKTLIVNE